MSIPLRRFPRRPRGPRRRDARGVVALGASAALALGLAGLGAPSAQAADPTITVTSPRCGVIRATASLPSGTSLGVVLDQPPSVGAPADAWFTRTGTKEWTNVPSGLWSWSHWDTLTGRAGVVKVAPCSASWPRRLPQGDETGDGRADVLAITTTGELRFYPGSAAGLAPGTTIGHGWGTTVHAQRIKQLGGPGHPNALLAVRVDGTLWQYRTGSWGSVWGGKQIGSGLGGYRGYAISPVTTDYEPWELYGLREAPDAGGQEVVALGQVTDGAFQRYTSGEAATDQALQPGTSRILFAQNMGVQGAFHGLGLSKLLVVQDDGDLLRSEVYWYDRIPTRNIATGTQIGHGWGAMQLLSSPGSLDGDAHSDLVTRRSDGDLYLYRTVNGTVQPGAVIGHNWNGIKLLA